AAAMAAMFVMLIYPWIMPAESTLPPAAITQPDAVGIIASALDARWEDSTLVKAGEPVTPGTRTLAAGLAQVTFKTGATVYIEAPATFEAIADDHMRLLRGKIVGHCPPGAQGF